MDELQQYRAEIDAIDAQLVSLFQQRMDVSRRVGEYKSKKGLPVLDPDREKVVLEAKAALVDDPMLKNDVRTLFETILVVSRQRQQRLVKNLGGVDYARFQADWAERRTPLADPRVLYQGVPGAYAEEAAARFFGEDCRRSNVSTWEDLFVRLNAGEADYGVVPIENSSTGAIQQVYDLLAKYGAFVVGEQLVKVEHCLMAPKGATLDTVRTVYSHEQGLLQCGEFLKAHPGWTTETRLNTAESAQFVAGSGDVTKAAICSRRAAALYGLDILAEGVNTSGDNFTRFVVVSPVMERREGADKVSAVFVVPHKSGTLHQIMTIFAVNGLNMDKLESRPMPDKNWEYMFFVNFYGDLAAEGMDGVVRELFQAVNGMRILGNYKSGK